MTMQQLRRSLSIKCMPRCTNFQRQPQYPQLNLSTNTQRAIIPLLSTLITRIRKSLSTTPPTTPMAEPQVLRVLMEMKEIRTLTLTFYFTATRLSSYPSFSKLYELDLTFVGLRLEGSNSDFKSWLNSSKFPSLTVLTIPLQLNSKQMNDSLNSLNVKVLRLVTGEHSDGEYRPLCLRWSLQMPKSLEFLFVGHEAHREVMAQLQSLDLTKCNKLIGIKAYYAISFKSIIWKQSPYLLCINIPYPDYYSRHYSKKVNSLKRDWNKLQ